MTHSSHDTRYSDSSLYDEVCKACGGTDAIGDTSLNRPCPAVHRHGVTLTNTPRAGETQEQVAARYHRHRSPEADADLVAFAKTGGPRLRPLAVADLAPAMAQREAHFNDSGVGLPSSFDLVAHLERQRQFSFRTFGPGSRTKGVVDHIRKELVEIEQTPHDLEEWVDLIMLACDGAWRSGHSPEQIALGLSLKLAKNERRTWPDWRSVDPDKAIEHDRSGEVR